MHILLVNVRYYCLLIDRDLIFLRENNFNLYKFPLETLIEILISFTLVVFGSIKEFLNFEVIYVNKQAPEKKLKNCLKPLISSLSSKGGMLNHFL